MAGLTKEQRAEREAMKQNEIAGQDTPGLIRMRRFEPSHSGGPVQADVHPGDVELWIDEGWLKDTSEEE